MGVKLPPIKKLKELKNIQNNIESPTNKQDYYIIKVPTKLSERPRKYFRISKFVNSYQPADRFNGWYEYLAKQDSANKNLSKEELIKKGFIEGEKTKESQAKKGTRKHKYIENFYKKNDKYSICEWNEKLENFIPFINIFKPLVLETKIFYENTYNKYLQKVPNGNLIGLAGTFDALGEVNGEKLSFEKNGKAISDGNFLTLVDWKHPLNVKYPVKKYKEKITYPLINYGLQLSCYVAGINQRTNNNYKLNQAMVVIAPEKSKTCYIYYFSPKALKWYWDNAQKMMVALANNEKHEFDYKFFEKETYSKGYHGQRLYVL